MSLHHLIWASIAVFVVSGCSKKIHEEQLSALHTSTTATTSTEQQQPQDIEALAYIKGNETYNFEAPIPAQCYTKTESKHNPCYICHQTYKDDNRPNKMNDGFQQGSYAFSEIGESNSWNNLFKDRTKAIEKVSDSEIIQYIEQDNYAPLIEWMKSDAWNGAVPEIKNLSSGAAAFDKNGLALDGSRWVAFNYKPLPSTFWPTNGATDDTFIRLPEKFSELNGAFSKDIYYANLSLVEMVIADTQTTTTIPLNETVIGQDLNGDKVLSNAVTTIKRQAQYVGDAKNEVLTPMLYPENTAFLHTVRYVGIDEEKIVPSKRMKEVRYMQKTSFLPSTRIASRYYQEFKDKHFEKLPLAVDKEDRGTSNGFGWMLWGFIEDEHGSLRKQHQEEQFFCIGCHKSIGTTIDHTFSFPRKVAGSSGWGYIDLTKIADVPNIGETKGEYLTYLDRVGGGDEFRQNTEMLSRWFDQHGAVDTAKVEQLTSIYELITPSPERALALNKAYREVVKEQSYLYGRDVVLSPATNVFEQINTEVAPLKPEFRYSWDIRLNWQPDQVIDEYTSVNNTVR